MASQAEQKLFELISKPAITEAEKIEKENAHNAFYEEIYSEQKDIVDELQSVGLNVNTIYDLVNTRKAYPEAIDILLKHLPRPYHLKNKEGIIRALTVKEAAGKASPVLIAEYNNTPKDNMYYRWVIGNAITQTITRADIDSILQIIQDKENGSSRSSFILALGKIKPKNAEDILIDLLDDDELVKYALNVLGKMKSIKAKEKIEQLLPHANREIKKEAERALKKIEAGIMKGKP